MMNIEKELKERNEILKKLSQNEEAGLDGYTEEEIKSYDYFDKLEENDVMWWFGCSIAFFVLIMMLFFS